MAEETQLTETKPAREPTEYEHFRVVMERPTMQRDLQATLGTPEKVKQFTRVTLTAIQRNPELLVADRKSLLLACMKAAEDDLLPDGREAVFNVYRTEVERGVWKPVVQYLPMAGGLIKKLYDIGCTYVDAAAVYENDKFRFVRGDNPHLEHEPIMLGDPGEIICAYLVVKLPNGEIKREVMPRRDIDKVRNASKQPNGLMWSTYFDQGAIKSVIKRGYKQLPHSAALDRLIEHDNEIMGFQPIEHTSAPEVGGPPKAISNINAEITGSNGSKQRSDHPTIPRGNVGKEQTQADSPTGEQPQETFAGLADKMTAAARAEKWDLLDEVLDLSNTLPDEAERMGLQQLYEDLRPEAR